MASESPDTSLNESIDENLCFLDMELEALQSIFINELEVKENENYTTVSIDLYPSTADKLDEQYVRMTLEFILSEEYPESIPDIKIRNPRGLSDEELNSIIHDLCSIAESKKGSSMLFEMIDAAKEHLTVGNRPCGECAICLHGFSDNDIFTKTECYHYFHSHCLARYARNFFENSSNSEDDAENKSKSEELLCPMCRIPIEFDEWDVDYPPPEESEESSFTLSEEMIELQKKMANLFQKQVKKGGIIDVEAEKKKYLLEISNIPTRLNNEEQKLAAEGDSAADSKSLQSEEIGSPTCDVKDVKDRSRNFDHRGRNRNFNRVNESRGYNRYGQRYNKQAFNRGNYNRYGYGKQNVRNSYQDEVASLQHQTKDSSASQDITKSEDLTLNMSSDVVETDDASEISEYPSPGSKPKYNPNFSPRYKNRGYHHGRNNYNYDSSRRSDKFSYNERRNLQPSHRYSIQRAEESTSKYEKKDESDLSMHDDINYKSDYRSGNYKHDNGYYSKQRYSDNRNNSYRGFKGAYGGRDAYSNSYNSRSNRYTDAKDREQYSDRNYREKYADSKDREQYPERNYRGKYSDSKDREQYSERNYRGKYTDSKDREQYSERNYREKYTDSKDREQYSERNYREKYPESKDREEYPERNYREKRTYNRDMKYKNNDDTAYNYRDMKYKNNDETAYNRSKQGSRNYTGGRSERYSDRSYNEPSNNESKTLEINNQNQNGDHDTLPPENGSSDPQHNLSQREKSVHKKDVTDFEEKSSNVVSAFNSSSSNSFPNAFSENSDVTPRTVNPPPGFANPLKKVVYGLQGANPPPGFNKS